MPTASQDPAPQDPQPRSKLPVLFGLGIILLGVWAAWLTSSWVVLAVAVAVAMLPARTHGGDIRAWARRRQGGGPGR